MIATASRRNQDFLRELGAEPVDYTLGDVSARVHALAGATGTDAAFDLFGGDAQEQAFSVLRRGGRIVSIKSPAAAPPRLREPLRLRAPERLRPRRDERR